MALALVSTAICCRRVRGGGGVVVKINGLVFLIKVLLFALYHLS